VVDGRGAGGGILVLLGGGELKEASLDAITLAFFLGAGFFTGFAFFTGLEFGLRPLFLGAAFFLVIVFLVVFFEAFLVAFLLAFLVAFAVDFLAGGVFARLVGLGSGVYRSTGLRTPFCERVTAMMCKVNTA